VNIGGPLLLMGIRSAQSCRFVAKTGLRVASGIDHGGVSSYMFAWAVYRLPIE
jgi:hypothetical protein